MQLPKAHKKGAAEPEPADDGLCGLCGKQVDKEEDWIEGGQPRSPRAAGSRSCALLGQGLPLPAMTMPSRASLGRRSASSGLTASPRTFPLPSGPSAGTCTECGTRPFCFECVANFMERVSCMQRDVLDPGWKYDRVHAGSWGDHAYSRGQLAPSGQGNGDVHPGGSARLLCTLAGAAGGAWNGHQGP